MPQLLLYFDTKAHNFFSRDQILSTTNDDVESSKPGWKTAKFYKILYVTEHFLKDFGWFI